MTTDSTNPIKWGIIGPGSIARSFARGIEDSRNGTLAAIATRDPSRPGLSEAFPGARILEGYEALLADPEIEAVYVATPHPFHAEWAIKAARAGKHVMVEKPMGLTSFEADAIFHEARKAGIFAAEAFMYRVHPQTEKLVELIGSGAIGEVRVIQSSFGFALPHFMPEHRLYANDLAGGGILDVGCYPVSMARLIAGAAAGGAPIDPVRVVGTAHLGLEGTDEWSAAVLHFPNAIIAQVSCAVSVQLDNVLRIFGTTGRIEVTDFWFASGRQGGTGIIAILRPDGAREEVAVTEKRSLFTFEVEAAGEAIRAGRQELSAPGMSWADTLGNMRVLDKWRADVGLEYGIEKAARRTKTLDGRTLAQGGTAIPKQTLPGLSKPASKVALGFEEFATFSSGAILLDAFYEAGGNVFDTGFIYRAGYTETLLGQWMKSRGVREEAVVIAKGAHSPLVYPDVIAKQLDQSLERLQTDHVDVYFMHRDNPDIPVGEFVDAMDAEVAAGRIRGLFGGSNWTRERLDAAIAYARKNGKTAPEALSNNFSLAEMVDPVWAGCVHASDRAWKDWLTERQLPNFAWSSQARGFFTDRAGRDRREDEELVRCWYSEENFARRDRAIELAERLGKSPIHVALAYVLAQPFPVVPLIGPRRLVELEDSLKAFEITLTPEDVAWLDNG